MLISILLDFVFFLALTIFMKFAFSFIEPITMEQAFHFAFVLYVIIMFHKIGEKINK